MGVRDELISFINKYKVEKGVPYTNTSLGYPKASIAIPDEKYDEFIDLYSLSLINGSDLHYTEKPRNPSCIRIDLDFRFPVDETSWVFDEETNKKYLKRVYKQEHIDHIIDTYFKVINSYIDIPDDCNIAYIMEKPVPSENRNKIKDGVHIVFPNIIVSNNVQHFIRKKILDVGRNLFLDLPLCNDNESIIDKAIIDVNCWLMYGSKKIETNSYRVTHVYKFSEGETKKDNSVISAAQEIEFIKLFSMRKTIESRTLVKDDCIAEIDEYTKHVLPSIDNKYKNKLHNNIFAKSLNVNKNYTSNDELIIIKRIVMECLSYSRAEKYDDWINLGWVLRNIDYRLIDTWIEFSKIACLNILCFISPNLKFCSINMAHYTT